MKSANWETSSPQRILLIKPSAIGDVVHALPVLALLRRKWPAAHIAWLVTPACSSLIEGHPLLNEVILFQPQFRGVEQTFRDAAGLWPSIRDVFVELSCHSFRIGCSFHLSLLKQNIGGQR